MTASLRFELEDRGLALIAVLIELCRKRETTDE